MNWLTIFYRKIIAKIIDHIVGVFVAAFICVFSLVLVAFRKWLQAQHSLQLTGWLWALIVIGISIIPALLVFIIRRWKDNKNSKRKLLSDETDIKITLRHWCQQIDTDGWGEQKERNKIVNFSDMDKYLGLISGSTKRYIEDIIKEFPGWKSRNKGLDTIEISHT